MSDKAMSDETRKAIKSSLGIGKTVSYASCKNCYYHPLENICNMHYIKTDNDDTCAKFKKDTKFKFISGGGMSPR